MNEGYQMPQNLDGYRGNYFSHDQKKRIYEYGEGLVTSNTSYGRFNTSQREVLLSARKQMRS